MLWNKFLSIINNTVRKGGTKLYSGLAFIYPRNKLLFKIELEEGYPLLHLYHNK